MYICFKLSFSPPTHFKILFINNSASDIFNLQFGFFRLYMLITVITKNEECICWIGDLSINTFVKTSPKRTPFLFSFCTFTILTKPLFAGTDLTYCMYIHTRIDRFF